MATKKQIIDSTTILLTRFKESDDSRLDYDYIGYLVEQARVIEIQKEYNVTGVIDQNWLLDLGIYDLTKVNFADDPNVTFCECSISKVEIPEIAPLTSLGEGNLDLGLRVISACGKKAYTFKSIDIWRHIPSEHIMAKFGYYQRFGSMLYVNQLVNKLRLFGIPATTNGLMIKKTLPVISGSIKSGYSYTVKGTSGSVTYDAVVYLPNQTFTGTSTTTFTASGSCQVFYTNYEVEMLDTDPYPVSAHMARQIVVSIISTEMNIERQQAEDIVNDSQDEALKKWSIKQK